MTPTANDGPLVSCIMPTYNRRHFVPGAIRSFLRQDFPNKELVIVDDGTDAVCDLVPADPRLRYIRLPQRATVGAKRNLACDQAGGSLIAHWDDDDWHAPRRLRCQVEALLAANADLCGLKTLLFYDARPMVRRGSMLTPTTSGPGCREARSCISGTSGWGVASGRLTWAKTPSSCGAHTHIG